ncbi:MAG: tetratricopeptide repeat protein [Limisphaerales bacterium]
MCIETNNGPARRVRQRIGSVLGILLVFVFAPRLLAAEAADGRELLLKGDFQKAIDMAAEELEEDRSDEDWNVIKLKGHMAIGQYAQALGIVTNAFKRYPLSTSIRLKLAAREVYLYNGYPDEAETVLSDINRLASTRTWAYQDPVNITTLGEAALLLGADPKTVLDRLLLPSLKADDTTRETYLAIGNLALAKGDYAMAAKHFQEGIKKIEGDPDLHFGLAVAYRPSDRETMQKAIAAAMEINEHHVPCKLLMVDHLVDGEQYGDAEELLGEVLKVNPWHPEAWAFRAVIAHLKNKPEDERKFRQNALKHYSNNPEVDHLIGRKMSQKYRFKEGAAAQRQALVFDPDLLKAKIQLSQDLLRLGDEEEGWSLANEVHEDDGFDVTAFNLLTLKDATDKYAVLTNEYFIVRMDKREAEIWGEKALDLLTRAHQELTKKYDIKLLRTTIVEIFASQNDFAVRTFGMPGNPGFLGVCFGSVITANSPSTQDSTPSNWEAVLWHEFAHVITLSKTKNKMPRWLSEGISVYEELQKDTSWGQRMTPEYVRFISDGDLTPVSKLSLAFLRPKTPKHLQFAYYESYLVVDYIIREFGIEALRNVLNDLGKGDWINVALERHCKPMDELDEEFEDYVETLAKNLAPELDFSDPKEEKGFFGGTVLRDDNGDPVNLGGRPKNNYFALIAQAKAHLSAGEFEEAKKPLNTILKAYPMDISGDGALRLLALVHRELGDIEAERKLQVRLALQDADAVDANTRLLELEAARENWTGVQKYAGKYLAINPLRPIPYRFLAEASEKTKQPERAITAWDKVLLLDPADPAEVHFRLASLHARQNEKSKARIHILKSLEEAPRYRKAHRLLLKLNEKKEANEAK